MPTNYTIVEPIGMQAPRDSSTTQKHPLGTLAKVVDRTSINCEGSAIYIKSTDAVLEGSLVDYDLQAATGVLAPAAGGTGPCGVALADIPSGSFGWVQVTGIAKVKAPNAMVVGAEIFSLAATPGSVDDVAVAGEQILNAQASTSTGTPAAGFALISINWPFHQGQIT